MACNAWYRLRTYFRSSVRSHRNLIIDTLTGLKLDFTQSQIDAIMGSGNERKQQPASSTRKTAPQPPVDAPTSSHAPVYPKVHTDYMATETLRY